MILVFDLHLMSGDYLGPASELDVRAFQWWCGDGRRGYLIRNGRRVVVVGRTVSL